MATVLWLGKQQTTRMVRTITIGGTPPSASTTLTVTAGGQATVTYTAATSEALATVATGLLAALNASINGEFREIAFAAGTSVTITATGPTDGAPITLAVSGSANGLTIAIATTTAATSPYDYNDGANWSGGTVPTAADVVVFEDNAIDVRYNLDAIPTVAFTSLTIRDTYTGRIGLDDVAPAGYRQYRATAVTVRAATQTIQQSANAGPLQIRIIDNYAAGTAAYSISGPGGGSIGREAVEINLNGQTANLVNNGGSVLVNPLQSQTGALGTVTCTNGVLRIGPTVTTAAAWTLADTQSEINAAFNTLTVNGASDVVCRVNATGAGSAPALTIESGAVRWNCSGAVGGIVIGTGATFDMSACPSTANTGSITMLPGSTLIDPNFRATSGYAITLSHCSLAEASVNVGTNRVLTVT